MWVVMGGEQPMVALALLLIYSVLEIVFKQGWAWAVKESICLDAKKPPVPAKTISSTKFTESCERSSPTTSSFVGLSSVMDSVRYNWCHSSLQDRDAHSPVSGNIGIINCQLQLKSPLWRFHSSEVYWRSQGYVVLDEEQPTSNDGSVQGNKVLVSLL